MAAHVTTRRNGRSAGGLTDPVERIARAAREVHETGYATLVLDRVARQTSRVVGAERACILVCDAQDPLAAIVVAGAGLDDDLIGRRFGRDEGLAGRVLATGEPVFARHYTELSWPMGEKSAKTARAEAAVPIRWGGEVRGVLSAITMTPHRFRRRDVDVLAELADLAAAALEHGEQRDDPDRSVEARVESLAAALELRDCYTGQHSEEVVALARAVGERLQLSSPSLVELEFAARLHDVGKLAVPDSILQKPGPLDTREWKVMRRHPRAASEMLAGIPGLEAVALVARFHHERWDGDGYPDGLEGERIPLASRVISVCDAYDAMTSDRPYRPALSRDAALRELREGAGSQFDPWIVESLIEVLEEQQPLLAAVAA